jgi:hypothetical protein
MLAMNCENAVVTNGMSYGTEMSGWANGEEDCMETVDHVMNKRDMYGERKGKE